MGNPNDPSEATHASSNAETASQSQGAGAKAKQVRQAAQEGLESAARSGKAQLESGKQAAAEQAEQVADAVEKVGQELKESDQHTLASYATDFAESLSGFADALRRKNVNELLTDAQALARRNPRLFVAGSVGLGFAIARLLKASARENVDEDKIDRSRQYYRREHGEDFSEPSQRGADADENPMGEGTLQAREQRIVTGSGGAPEPGVSMDTRE